MTITTISSHTKEVKIGFDEPFVIIGERINPTGSDTYEVLLEIDKDTLSYLLRQARNVA